MKHAVAALTAVLLWSPAVWSATRFAVVLGSDAGAAGHPRLWFAERDAVRFAGALTELGDFPADHVAVLREATVHQFLDALVSVEGDITAARSRGERTLLVVYFSGHATPDGLELGSERVPYQELRALLVGSRADARVALVDACDSGALTQVKGGRPSATVNFPLPVEDHVEGVAFIASTAVGEPAQESQALEGSFFTTHFEAALRGAGDFDGDGQVTLTEAFRYTAAQTTSATARTRAGAQHPTYEMRMSGRGDVVLADLRRAESSVTLPPAEGTDYVIRGSKGVVAEVPGSSTSLRMALLPGHYVIERRSSAGLESVAIDVARGDALTLPGLKKIAFQQGVNKGGRPPVEVFAGVALSSGLMVHEGGAWSGQVGVSRRFGPIRGRLTLEYGQDSVQDAGLNYALSNFGGAAAVLVPLLLTDAPRLELGPQIGVDWASQQLQSGQSYGTLDLRAEGVLSFSYPVGILRVGTDVTAGVHRFELNDVGVYRFAGGAAVTLGAEF